MSARVVKQQLNTLLSGGLLASSDSKQVIQSPAPPTRCSSLRHACSRSAAHQGGSRGTPKTGSKVQKNAKKERLRQKRKRIAEAAAAAGSTDDVETVRERNLRYYVETARADVEVQKLMREVQLMVVALKNHALPACHLFQGWCAACRSSSEMLFLSINGAHMLHVMSR